MGQRDVRDLGGQHRNDEVDDVVIGLPCVVEPESLAPAREDHRDGEAEVVQARQVDRARNEQGDARDQQVRHPLHLPEHEEHECAREERGAEQIERIANGPAPVAHDEGPRFHGVTLTPGAAIHSPRRARAGADPCSPRLTSSSRRGFVRRGRGGTFSRRPCRPGVRACVYTDPLDTPFSRNLRQSRTSPRLRRRTSTIAWK
jgi:hypothetical protein